MDIYGALDELENVYMGDVAAFLPKNKARLVRLAVPKDNASRVKVISPTTDRSPRDASDWLLGLIAEELGQNLEKSFYRAKSEVIVATIAHRVDERVRKECVQHGVTYRDAGRTFCSLLGCAPTPTKGSVIDDMVLTAMREHMGRTEYTPEPILVEHYISQTQFDLASDMDALKALVLEVLAVIGGYGKSQDEVAQAVHELSLIFLPIKSAVQVRVFGVWFCESSAVVDAEMGCIYEFAADSPRMKLMSAALTRSVAAVFGALLMRNLTKVGAGFTTMREALLSALSYIVITEVDDSVSIHRELGGLHGTETDEIAYLELESVDVRRFVDGAFIVFRLLRNSPFRVDVSKRSSSQQVRAPIPLSVPLVIAELQYIGVTHFDDMRRREQELLADKVDIFSALTHEIHGLLAQQFSDLRRDMDRQETVETMPIRYAWDTVESTVRMAFWMSKLQLVDRGVTNNFPAKIDEFIEPMRVLWRSDRDRLLRQIRAVAASIYLCESRSRQFSIGGLALEEASHLAGVDNRVYGVCFLLCAEAIRNFSRHSSAREAIWEIAEKEGGLTITLTHACDRLSLSPPDSCTFRNLSKLLEAMDASGYSRTRSGMTDDGGGIWWTVHVGHGILDPK